MAGLRHQVMPLLRLLPLMVVAAVNVFLLRHFGVYIVGLFYVLCCGTLWIAIGLYRLIAKPPRGRHERSTFWKRPRRQPPEQLPARAAATDKPGAASTGENRTGR
jgi:hypothetical protein